MNGILHIPHFIDNPDALFHFLIENVEWDERMHARKTASYGHAYNYSQMHYPYKPFLPELDELGKRLEPVIGFVPNNCLINYYMDGKSKMGFHSDQTDILETGTGVAILSVGEARILRFKKIGEPEATIDYELNPGSLFYMTQEIQDVWQHAIPPSDTENGRISLTFRSMID
jgi:alkylated DNA repair dioxygenase AlkB